MSYEHEIESIDDDVLTVAVQGSDDGYVLWQKVLTEEIGSDDGMYFEYDDQKMVVMTTLRNAQSILMESI